MATITRHRLAAGAKQLHVQVPMRACGAKLTWTHPSFNGTHAGPSSSFHATLAHRSSGLLPTGSFMLAHER